MATLSIQQIWKQQNNSASRLDYFVRFCQCNFKPGDLVRIIGHPEPIAIGYVRDNLCFIQWHPGLPENIFTYAFDCCNLLRYGN